MSWVVLGAPTGVSREFIMTIYPRHKALVDELDATGDILGIGPFADRGNLGIFRSRETAERFMNEDPFAHEGCVTYTLHEWAGEVRPA